MGYFVIVLLGLVAIFALVTILAPLGPVVLGLLIIGGALVGLVALFGFGKGGE